MQNPLKTLRAVRVNPTDPDPAVDVTKTDFRKYILTRDETALVFHEGQTPVYFDVKRLPAAFCTDVLDGVYPLAARRLLAFRAAVHRVEAANGPVEVDGNPLVVYEEKVAPKGAAFIGRDGGHGTDIAPTEFVQAVADQFGAECIQELGQVALDFARLPRGKRGPFSSWGGSVASG